ncbi:MAG: alpha/beta hydrolase [Rhodobacteraceae bacterium]|nr:alpha/beta hydrolase [Paracoccaceae bacterium]
MYSPLILLGLVIGLCMVAWFSRSPFTSRTRRSAPGEFTQLSGGTIHYQWHGDPSNPIIVMVHGLTTPSFVWRDMVPLLVKAGYRVLTFDHFGRGFSDRPREAYTTEFYVRELDELLVSLQINGPFHLLGYSMGGGLVSSYAAQRRDKIRKLVLLAPTGFQTELGGFIHWAAKWPVIGDLAVNLVGGFLIRRAAKATAKSEGVDQEMIQLQCRETRFSGYLSAVLSSVRNVTQLDHSQTHRVIADREVPVLAVFGETDEIIPISSSMALRTINRNAEIAELSDVGHAMAYTHAQLVADIIVGFLDRQN